MNVRTRSWLVAIAIPLVASACGLTDGSRSADDSSADGAPDTSGGDRGSITVQTHGGTWQEKFRDTIVVPFEEETGITVNLVEGENVEVFNSLRATGGENPQYDLAVVSQDLIPELADDDLIQAIDTAQIAEWENINPYLYDGAAGQVIDGSVYAIPTVVGRVGIAYRTDMLDEEPTSWMSVLKDESLSGRIGLMPPAAAAGVSFLLEIADEQGYDTTDPESVTKAIESLEFLRDSVSVFPDSNATVDRLLTTGDIWVAPAFDGRAFVLQDSGAPVGFAYSTETGAVAYGNPFILPTGVEDTDLIYEFINYMLQPDPLGAFGSAMFYGTAHNEATYTEEASAVIETDPDSYADLIWPDADMIREHSAEWQQAWNEVFR